MKQGLAIFLTALFISVGCRDFITIASFYINQDFIAANWCINQAKPELKCDGKCYLRQQLKQNSAPNKDQKIPIPLLIDHLELKVICSEFSVFTSINNALKRKHFPIKTDANYLSDHLSKVFQPPELLLI